MVFRIGGKGWLRINDPAVNAVGRTSGAEVGDPASVLHSTKQKGGSISQSRCTGVEDGVNGIRPISGGKNGILDVAGQEFQVFS